MFKKVMRWDPREKKLRIARVFWVRGIVGKGGYSACLSFSLMPVLLSVRRGSMGIRVVVFGFSAHYRRSYGGLFC